MIDAPSDVAPALGEHVVAYGFGDVYARPGLEPKQRQLATIGTLNAIFVAKQVFAERGLLPVAAAS